MSTLCIRGRRERALLSAGGSCRGDGGILLEELVHLFLRHIGVRFQQPVVEIEGIVIAQPARGVRRACGCCVLESFAASGKADAGLYCVRARPIHGRASSS